MFIVGLTGGIGTGKSTVSEYFREHGIPVIDADLMARKVVVPGRKAWHRIMREFGETVFKLSGELDREALGDIIFNDIDKRKKLNDITHPEIYKEMMMSAVNYLFEGHQFIVMDLPLLYETGSMLGILHKTIVVTCDSDQQLTRVINRGGGLNEERAQKRILAQMPLEQKCQQANFVIDNSGNFEDLKKQVDQIVIMLKMSKAHWKPRIIFVACLLGLIAFLSWMFVPAKEIKEL